MLLFNDEIVALADTSVFIVSIRGDVTHIADFSSEYGAVSAPAVGDIDDDGEYEIVVEGWDALYAFHYDGALCDGFPAVLPYFIAAVAFSVIYLVFPADDVKPRYAIITGFFVAILWEFAREGFGFYVSKTIAYKTIYGSLWVVPMFMFWLYLVWTIILFGAEMVFVLQ